MRDKIRIGYLNGDIPARTFIEGLVDATANSGAEVFLYGHVKKQKQYPPNVHIRELRIKGAAGYIKALLNFLLFFLKNPKTSTQLLGHFRESAFYSYMHEIVLIMYLLKDRPDVLHVQWPKSLANYPMLRKYYKGKILLSLRGNQINVSPVVNTSWLEFYSRTFSQIDAFHAVSKAIALEGGKYNAPLEKTHIIYSGIADQLLSQNDGSANDTSTLKILSVGRFHWKKGYSYAIDAIRILVDKQIKVKYTIIAEGEIPEEILFQIHQQDLDKSIEIINGLSQEKVFEEMHSSHLLLLPSVEEGIANVVLEAMAVGLPVITTNCGGMTEAVQDKINGFIVAMRSPESIAEAVLEFLKMSPDQLDNLKTNARQSIQQKFLRSSMADNFWKLYNSLADTAQ
jgi:colanic acid/amylovoran biosynthesis glycosyltransferase